FGASNNPISISAGDNIGLRSSATLSIADAGITTTGDIYLEAATDIHDASGRDLTLNADNLYFISGMNGGDTTLTTAVNTLTASTTGAGNLSVVETDAVTFASVTTVDGGIDASAGGSITATLMTSGDAGGDQAHDINLTATAGHLALGSVSADDAISLTTTTGNVSDSNGATTNLNADLLTLAIGGSVDTDTAITTLSGSTTAAGDVSITETDAVTVSSFSTHDGAFTLTSGGTQTLISLTANDAGSDQVHDVHLSATAGDLQLGAVVADSQATLNAAVGSIVDINNDSLADITAQSASLSAGNAIGSLTDFDTATGNSVDLLLVGDLTALVTTASDSLAFVSGDYGINGAALTPNSSGSAQMLLENDRVLLDLAESDITYEAGDHLAVFNNGTLYEYTATSTTALTTTSSDSALPAVPDTSQVSEEALPLHVLPPASSLDELLIAEDDAVQMPLHWRPEALFTVFYRCRDMKKRFPIGMCQFLSEQ
ncbi:MAG: hypothetical protein KTR20_15605, partial [Cellvibrionaceae bacterium]|nr:hypothetical protein [Cellvibrionaceae bacterium]